MTKRNGYPTIELFRLQVAPETLRAIGDLRRTICGTRFPLNTPVWHASQTFLGSIDAFTEALTGVSNFFHDKGSGAPRRPTGPVDVGTEEWWRRQIESSKDDNRPWG